MIGDRQLPIAIHLFVGRTYHPPENMWFSDKPPTVHNSFGLQGRPFHQSVIIMVFIADDLQGFIDWHIDEVADSVKANENI
jgi:hypothetical protein